MSTDVTLQPVQRGHLSVHVFGEAASLGLDLFMTDRWGGVSPAPYNELNLGDHVGDDRHNVMTNRQRVASAAGVAFEDLVFVSQVHGADVLDLDTRAVSPADGLSTTTSSQALGILVADCVPVALVDPHSHRVTVVHAGWRGLAAGVLNRGLALHDEISALHAFVGPCISVEAYQVGPEVADVFSDVPGATWPDRGDRLRLDLRAITRWQLERAGVTNTQIYLSREVTDGGEMFFSDRAQRPCGRGALVAKWAF